MYIDFHVHTNKSDGLLSPKEVIDKALALNLDGLAITDHDNIDAYSEVIDYANEKGIYLIAAIEFSAIHNDEEIHILGYFIDVGNPKIISTIEKIKENRYIRGLKMIDKLIEIGLDISLEEVLELSEGNYIGRPHIARLLLNKSYVKNLQEAFSIYLNYGKVAYVAKEGPTLKEIITCIQESGGKAVLAHPKLLKNQSLIDDVIKLGIDGIEAVHSKHKPSDVRKYLNIAKENELLITGGSDCHGEVNNGELLMGKYLYEDLDCLEEIYNGK